jgi:hypothetical protein
MPPLGPGIFAGEPHPEAQIPFGGLAQDVAQARGRHADSFHNSKK